MATPTRPDPEAADGARRPDAPTASRGADPSALPASVGPAASSAGESPALASAGRTCAYFDLDKTILATSATIALGSPMRRSGLISTASLARGVLSQLPYLLVGADEGQTARLMERLALMSAGIERAHLQAVVHDALATAIEPAVYAEALDLIEAHHRAGHDAVVVSASLSEMVEPVAALVGADRAIATRMEVDARGRFTGRIAHSLLHGAKVDALAEDARDHGIDLARSWAYSDSISDRPMLRAVGHPVAVNPDRELRRLAEAQDWPVRDFARPVRVRRPRLPAPRPRTPGTGAGPVRSAVGLVTVLAAAGTASVVMARRRGR
ncbi:HAD family hydrolase [Actinomyces sp. oral taxon 448]|uniref:HAD family hydrolase n=1 Tax=Actinomyces sp. oral taxon 448 TaxID=712124 RepID=UPI0002188C3C|nr:HAD-IB family hydrolase [Actinomyces sp. oral taxon 448]EGQ75989.1 HAD-superfamily subfamily IB hydrolase [Actinomyces sp. oral taxon 448 str. F0400]